MTNWKEYGTPFQEFTEEITQQWINESFSKEQCKEWLDIGSKVGDSGYCAWLRNILKLTPEEILNSGDSKWLREQHEQHQEYINNWQNIHPDFAGYWGNKKQQEWRDYGFTTDAIKPWMKIGLSPFKDLNVVLYAKQKGYQPTKINKDELRKEYYKWLDNPPAQEYLNTFYPLAKREKTTELIIRNQRIKGELNLTDFCNLEKLDVSYNQITALIFTSLDNLWELKCHNNDLTNCDFLIRVNNKKLTILDLSNNNLCQDLIIFNKFTKLKELDISNNLFCGLLTSLVELKNLEDLNINNNDNIKEDGAILSHIEISHKNK